MSIKVKGHPRLAELIARHLGGISSVPPREAERMVSKAAFAAVEWHEKEVTALLRGLLSLRRNCEQRKRQHGASFSDRFRQERGKLA